jgi:transcriptional regulator with XRE-family HTH domain
MARERVVISDFVAKVGARLRVLRYERGLSLRKLAELAGCSAGGVMQIELGRSAPTTRTLGKLAEALSVQPFDILNYDSETDDLGWMMETMRREPECVRIVRARTKRLGIRLAVSRQRRA